MTPWSRTPSAGDGRWCQAQRCSAIFLVLSCRSLRDLYFVFHDMNETYYHAKHTHIEIEIHFVRDKVAPRGMCSSCSNQPSVCWYLHQGALNGILHRHLCSLNVGEPAVDTARGWGGMGCTTIGNTYTTITHIFH